MKVCDKFNVWCLTDTVDNYEACSARYFSKFEYAKEDLELEILPLLMKAGFFKDSEPVYTHNIAGEVTGLEYVCEDTGHVIDISPVLLER